MKKQVELVKKWLADNTSVTLEELKANKKAAEDDWDAARAAYWAPWATYRAAYWAIEAAYRDAYDAAYWATEAAHWATEAAHCDATCAAEHCKQLAREAIAEYEELTK